MSSTYSIKSDWSKVKRDIKRLKSAPSLTDKRKLDRVLRAGLAQAHADVHVDTSSLKWSGKTDSVLVGSVYRGTLTFGGISPGINNPVDYAIYELDRGGPHDYMRNAIIRMHPMWIGAIKEILRG
jgi:hypothetical protein